jgi:hypothetical protein
LPRPVKDGYDFIGWYLSDDRKGYVFNAEKLALRKERLGDSPLLNPPDKPKRTKIPPVGEAGRIDKSLAKRDGLHNPIAEAKKRGYFFSINERKHGAEYNVYHENKLIISTYSITKALRQCGIDGHRV